VFVRKHKTDVRRNIQKVTNYSKNVLRPTECEFLVSTFYTIDWFIFKIKI
jgi:hypothetical protein